MDLRADHAHLCSGPLFHIFTLMTALAHFHIGARNVVLNRMDGEEVARLIDAEKVTWAMVMGPSIPAVVAAAKAHGYALSTLRVPPMPARS